MRHRRTTSATLAALLASTAPIAAAPAHAAAPSAAAGALETGFQNPPNSARPRVWWHWMNGNITKDGIAKDIDWMSRMGIGGLQNFDAALTSPQIVEKRLVYMSPEWKDAFHYAASLADQRGLELAIASSPGWSETGGPWVPPKDAMKKLVWSEVVLQGGKRFDGPLPALPATTGPFQDIAQSAEGLESQAGAKPEYHADAAVLAYRLPNLAELPHPSLTAGGAPLDAAVLSDGRYVAGVDVPRGTASAPGEILASFDKPQTVRSLTMHLAGAAGGPFGPDVAPVLEASDGQGAWRKVADIPLSAVPTTVSFAPVTARQFRVVLKRSTAPNPAMAMMGAIPPGVDMVAMAGVFGKGASLAAAPAKTFKLTEFALHAGPRVNAFELKAGYSIADDYYALDAGAGPDVAGVKPADVIDLSGKIGPDGRLDWTPPKGRWKVVRLGYSLTGKENHPATPEATGLEVDKYDAAAVRNYLQIYLDMYAGATGKDLIGAHGLRAFLTDSTEVGPSNWTPNLVAQFKRLRGYDPTPWLPALTGVVVGSRAESDAFLYDFRRTLGDLMTSEHYGQVAAVAHERGLTLYGESLEGGRPVLGDDMEMRRYTDVPMAALWTFPRGAQPGPAPLADIKGAASVAHIYGQNLVAAESLTSVMQPWAYAPRDLRRMIDLEFVTGVNRPVIHTSVHQPVDDKQPGLALQIFGQYFNRHESWAEMARPWGDYMARSDFLLQQGRNHADVAYFYGEEAPLGKLYHEGLPKDAPARYAYDFVSRDVVLNHLQVEGGELVASGGARYRVLYLGGTSRRMTLPVLRQIAALAEAGATVVGPAPEVSPALSDDPKAFAETVQRLWGSGRGGAAGRGRVIGAPDVETALANVGLTPDFSFAKSSPKSEVLFLHRTLADGEIFFLTNRTLAAETGEARFRVTGKRPEIWRADTGKAEPVSYRIEGGETVIPLDLAPEDSYFVVFRAPATAQSATVAKPVLAPVADIGSGPWQVSFQPGRGAPAQATLPALASLSDNPDPGVKYFSGVATYRKTFDLPKGVRPGRPLVLDLGKYGDVAEVSVNGRPVGTVWREPNRIDIGAAVKPGRNQLEVRVADLWVNRLIGDAQPGVTQKVTWTSTRIYTAKAPLRPSGLIGPVTLLADSK